jgi:hypothetical protein
MGENRPYGTPDHSPQDRADRVAHRVAQAFANAGWDVIRPRDDAQGVRPDLVLDKGNRSYIAEVKVASEGRADRLVPLWSQAYLEAIRLSSGKARPLAIVAAPRISRRVADQVLEFARRHAGHDAYGIVDLRGLRKFVGAGLDNLDADPEVRPSLERKIREKPADLFSDLNQWLLKVLLAPDVPEHLLNAPRRRYDNPSQLAKAAGVSAMTALRLVRQLQADGYRHESQHYLHLVNREDLFQRWEAVARRQVLEVPMRFLLRRDPEAGISKLARAGRGCLGLFAAADALGLGHVRGVPPHVYVRRLRSSPSAWKGLSPAEAGEQPDIVFRQAPFPESVFRGAVDVDDLSVADVLQVWLDVSSHPARGAEQAALIRKRIIEPIIEGEAHSGRP